MKSCCKEALPEPEEAPEEEPKNGIQRLKKKWKVKSMGQLLLILCTFALGGTACGIVGRQIMHHIGPDHKGLWILIYVLLITVLWPLCVLIISIPLGQLTFFKHYLSKLGRKIFSPNKK